MPGPATGSHVGKSLSNLLADTFSKAHGATVGHTMAAKDKATRAFLDRWEGILAPHLGELASTIVDDPNAPDWVKGLWKEIGAPTHDVVAILHFLALLPAVFGLAGAATTDIANQLEQASFKRNPNMALSPAEAALGVVKGTAQLAEAVEEAAMHGINADRFNVILGNTGEPPGPQELVDMLRRGIIDRPTFEHGVRQSRIRDEWIGALAQYTRQPISPADAVIAVIRGHLSAEEGAAIASEWGIQPEGFALLVESTGNPPGTDQLLELLNRGEIDQASVEQGIRESRVNNKWIPAILKLRRRIPPERSIVSMIGKGVLTPAEGLQHLLDLGFDPTDAAALAAEAHTDKVAAHRSIAEGQVLTGYRDRFIGHDQAVAMLGNLGYSVEDSTFILGLADVEHDRKLQDAATTRVRSLYVGRHIERDQAGVMLDALKVAPDQRNDLLRIWDIERGTVVKELTEAQVAGAYIRGLIDAPTFLARVKALGFSDDDAQLLLGLTTPAPTAAQRRSAPPGGP